MKKLVGLFAGLALLTGLPLAYAASLSSQQTLTPPTISSPACAEGSQMIPCLNALMAQINSQVVPNQMGAVTQWRNVIDNGAMLVNQRGNGTSVTATCGTTSGPGITGYSMDRWACDVNVGSGAGQLAMTTSTPTPPPGFTNQATLVKNSGSLAQPQCAWQEIKSTEVVPLQGQQVVFSAYIAALAGLAADGGNNASLVIISGTTADQGLGALRSAVGMTASPAITPAWAGLATLVNTSVAITTAYGRYSTTALVPVNAKELAVGICFTPGTSAGGSTDGIAFTGVQLEQGSVAGNYEQRNFASELTKVQHEFYAYPEPAANVVTPIVGTAVSASNWTMTMQFPVAMDVAPTFQEYGTALGVTTFKGVGGGVTNALASTFMVTNTANTPQNASLTVTGAGMTAGFAVVLIGNNAGAIPSWSADF